MKKKYITPACTVMKMELENTLLSVSQGDPDKDNSIGDAVNDNKDLPPAPWFD